MLIGQNITWTKGDSPLFLFLITPRQIWCRQKSYTWRFSSIEVIVKGVRSTRESTGLLIREASSVLNWRNPVTSPPDLVNCYHSNLPFFFADLGFWGSSEISGLSLVNKHLQLFFLALAVVFSLQFICGLNCVNCQRVVTFADISCHFGAVRIVWLHLSKTSWTSHYACVSQSLHKSNPSHWQAVSALAVLYRTENRPNRLKPTAK